MTRYYGELKWNDPYHDWEWDNDGFPGEYVYGDDMYVDEYYMDERWKPIRGFENEYWVSDKARVWSVKKQRFLKLWPADDWGHLGVYLCKDGICHHRYIHRLIGEAFIPNPDNLPLVRHLNDIPWDNELQNLAWGTNGDNTRDAIKNGKFRQFTDEERERGYKKCRVPIVVYDLETGERIVYDGVAIAARELGICRSSISKVLAGVRDSARGFTFSYLERGDRNG